MNFTQETFGSVELVDSMTAVEFDTETEVFRAAYDADRDSVSLAVVAVVATASNSDPMEMAPLHSSVDTGSLEELFSASPRSGQRSGSISFAYEGFEVTVFSEGVIKADPRSADCHISGDNVRTVAGAQNGGSEQLATALQAQKRRVLVALMEDATVDATPILRSDEHLSGEDYTTLVYEFHHVLLPELMSVDCIQFDQREGEISRGDGFDGELSELEDDYSEDSADLYG